MKSTFTNLKRVHIAGIGAIMGILAFLIIYGFTPLQVTQDDWLRNGYIEADILQHYAGWLFFRESPLTFPFGFTSMINWPDGQSIAFTDSIPFFSVLFRFLQPILPATFQFFGWFTLLCFTLMGAFSALLLSHFIPSPLPLFCGVIPFVLSPILLERSFRHTALAFQWVIVAALFYYFEQKRCNRFNFIGLFAINCWVMAIHPYFVPMTYGITFGLLLDYALRNKKWLTPAGYLACNLLCSLGMGYVFGLFQPNGSGSGGSGVSYGYFSMNLNALWNPTSRAMDSWSLFLPVQNQTAGNYDGFNYLGLGILLGMLLSIVAFLRLRGTKGFVAIVKRHASLIAVYLCFTLFAVSNQVTANGATIARIPLPEFFISIATTFRSSGRIFWPVYYLIMTSAIVGCFRLGRMRSKTMAFAAVCMVSLVQLADLAPGLAQKYQSFRPYQSQGFNLLENNPKGEVLNAFLQATPRYEHLVALSPLKFTGLSLSLYTADQAMTSTDTSFIARFNEENHNQLIQTLKQQIADGAIPDDTLFLTEEENVFLQLAESAQAQGAWCGVIYDHQNAPLVYVIAPGMQEYQGDRALEYSDQFPLRVATDYSDNYWDQGVLSWNLEQIERTADKDKVILIHDTPLARRKLSGASAIRCDGVEYPILSVSDKDAGWLMVTLEIDDAHKLQYNDLEVLS